MPGSRIFTFRIRAREVSDALLLFGIEGHFASSRPAELLRAKKKIKLLRTGDGTDDDRLPADDDGGLGIGLPGDWWNQISRGFQNIAGIIVARDIGRQVKTALASS
jgi:hypothetical protein